MLSAETCLTPLTQFPVFIQVLVCLPEFGQTLGVTALVQSASVQTGVVERVELVLVDGEEGPVAPRLEQGTFSGEVCITPPTQSPFFIHVITCTPDAGQTLGVVTLVQLPSVQAGKVGVVGDGAVAPMVEVVLVGVVDGDGMYLLFINPFF
jgi:hypothetical protein